MSKNTDQRRNQHASNRCGQGRHKQTDRERDQTHPDDQTSQNPNLRLYVFPTSTQYFRNNNRGIHDDFNLSY